ncbi:MAG: hypothetical protein IJ167_06320 [Lachnospiraceae bacterium]|nr:hypothetical protein [Lachnospiraceae bacterium]
MICPQCKFDNKDGALFCEQCGEKLIEAPKSDKDEKTDNIEADKSEDIKDEESTTILTADMLDPKSVNQPSQNQPSPNRPEQNRLAQNQPSPNPAGIQQGMVGGQPGAMIAPQYGQRPMGNQPAGMQPQTIQGKTSNKQKAPNKQKPAKETKQPKQKKGKLGGGMIAYIIISLLLIFGMAGVGVWGYLHYTDKIDKLKDEKESITKELDTTKALVISKDDEIKGLESSNADLKDENSSLQSQVADYEEQISDLSSINDQYAPLIDFADNDASGQGYDDFFVSDTVVHLSGGTKSIKIFYEPEDGTIYPSVADGGVATCSWQDGWGDSGYVATLDLTPVATGMTTVTISNDFNEESITIFVIVD